MLMKLKGQLQKGRNQKGFTLVELMVVVVIIGILVGIAVPVYNAVTLKAEKAAIEANLRTIDGAIMTYCATIEDPRAEGAEDFNLDKLVEEGLLQSDPSDQFVTYEIFQRDDDTFYAGFTGVFNGQTITDPVGLPVNWDDYE